MREPAIPRKARLRAALALNEKTLGDFAEMVGVSERHFHAVLNGERPSPRIDREIDQYIEAHLGKFAA